MLSVTSWVLSLFCYAWTCASFDGDLGQSGWFLPFKNTARFLTRSLSAARIWTRREATNASFVWREAKIVGLLLSLLTDTFVHISVHLNRLIHHSLLMTLEEKMFWKRNKRNRSQTRLTGNKRLFAFASICISPPPFSCDNEENNADIYRVYEWNTIFLFEFSPPSLLLRRTSWQANKLFPLKAKSPNYTKKQPKTVHFSSPSPRLVPKRVLIK